MYQAFRDSKIGYILSLPFFNDIQHLKINIVANFNERLHIINLFNFKLVNLNIQLSFSHEVSKHLTFFFFFTESNEHESVFYLHGSFRLSMNNNKKDIYILLYYKKIRLFSKK